MSSDALLAAPINESEAQRPEQPPPTESDKPEHTEPPYSITNELLYFIRVGIPLMCASILKVGVPPFFSMVVAGHTPAALV